MWPEFLHSLRKIVCTLFQKFALLITWSPTTKLHSSTLSIPLGVARDQVWYERPPFYTTNLRLEVAKEEIQRKQEVMERRKMEAVAAKQQRDRGGIGSSNENDDNYYSDTDDIDLDQEDNFNPVQGRKGSRGARDDTDWTPKGYLKTF